MKTVFALLLLVAGALANVTASASEWPNKPVKIVVPFGAGGQSDVIARLIAKSLGETFRQQFIVENQGGGGTVIGTRNVARAENDGYTLMISGMSSHVLSPAMNKDLGFDPIQDFTHIAYLGGSPTIFVVHPSSGVKNFEDFLRWTKSTEGGVQYVSPGVGSGGNSVAEFFASKAGIKLVHVPHRGGNTAVADLVAGHVKMGSLTWSTAREHVSAGTLIPVGISSGERVAGFDQIPTFREKGFPDVVTTVWLAVSGPRGMSADLTQKLNSAVNKALEQPFVRRHLEQDAFDVRLLSPAQTTGYFQSEHAKWVPAMRAALGTKP
jgi:tripartite-type tricarboxylate transporter receptor subunit TctC